MENTYEIYLKQHDDITNQYANDKLILARTEISI